MNRGVDFTLGGALAAVSVAVTLAVVGVAGAACDQSNASGANGARKHAALANFNAYDPHADGAKLIADAAARAKSEKKHVLVVFGGNWCKWCKALDGLFETDAKISSELARHWVVVHVDSDSNVALNEKYQNPFANGFPVMLVLDGDGNLLHTQESGAFEKEDKSVGHDPDRVLEFLKSYAPT
jgi:thiol-disulfide isomerase/thioredoxin